MRKTFIIACVAILFSNIAVAQKINRYEGVMVLPPVAADVPVVARCVGFTIQHILLSRFCNPFCCQNIFFRYYPAVEFYYPTG